MTQSRFTVVMRSDTAVSDETLEHIRETLCSLDNVTVTRVERVNALGMDRKEVLVMAVITYSMTVAANVTSTAITEAFSKNESTRSIQLEEVYETTEVDDETTSLPVQP